MAAASHRRHSQSRCWESCYLAQVQTANSAGVVCRTRCSATGLAAKCIDAEPLLACGQMFVIPANGTCDRGGMAMHRIQGDSSGTWPHSVAQCGMEKWISIIGSMEKPTCWCILPFCSRRYIPRWSWSQFWYCYAVLFPQLRLEEMGFSEGFVKIPSCSS